MSLSRNMYSMIEHDAGLVEAYNHGWLPEVSGASFNALEGYILLLSLITRTEAFGESKPAPRQPLSYYASAPIGLRH